jgi:hypothetical protein
MMSNGVFDAYQLPDESECPERLNSVNVSEDFSVRYPNFKALNKDALVKLLIENNVAIKSMPVSEIIQAIGRVSERLMDKDDPLRYEALDVMVPTAGISPQMAETILAGMSAGWTEKTLTELVEREFTNPKVLDSFQRIDSGRSQMVYGFTLNLTVGSGTVPGVGVTALIRALLLKSSILMKPGLGDVALPVLFARALGEENEVFRKCLAVFYWDGAKERIERKTLEKVGVVVAYGSDDSIRSIRDQVPRKTDVVSYSHRLGVGLVGREALSEDKARETAQEVAMSIATFDQRGCVSPQVLYVEQGGQVAPEDWVQVLASGMEELEEQLPAGVLSQEETIGVQQIHAAIGLKQLGGTGVQIYKGTRKSWAVIFEPEIVLKWSDCRRVIYVKPITDLMTAKTVLAPGGDYLQTVAIAGASSRKENIATSLTQIGVTRVTSFQQAPWPKPWWHHDGRSVFQGLFELIDLEDVVD